MPPRPPTRRRVVTPLAEFLGTEAAGGVVLLVATLAALVWANAFPDTYVDFWHAELTIGVKEDLQHWVNDGLMTIFFFVVGLEIKRELVLGELRDPRTAALPALAALGGMVVPAAIYVAWNAGSDTVDGWSVPMATDIAFAIGVLALIGSRAPAPLKLFLLTLAIVDDIGAILVIAVFYTDTVEITWLYGAMVAMGAVFALRHFRVSPVFAYLLPGTALWFCVLESGVHATLAGVVLGLTTPAVWPHGPRPLERLEHWLHPVSSFVVVPVFALANAGVRVDADSVSDALGSVVTWGILCGLVVGKLAGVTVATLVSHRIGIGRLPAGIGRREVGGAAALAGIGFTVALFVSDLSFGDRPDVLREAKLAVLAASVVAGVLGTAVLTFGARRAGRQAAAGRPNRPPAP